MSAAAQKPFYLSTQSLPDPMHRTTLSSRSLTSKCCPDVFNVNHRGLVPISDPLNHQGLVPVSNALCHFRKLSWELSSLNHQGLLCNFTEDGAY